MTPSLAFCPSLPPSSSSLCRWETLFTLWVLWLKRRRETKTTAVWRHHTVWFGGRCCIFLFIFNIDCDVTLLEDIFSLQKQWTKEDFDDFLLSRPLNQTLTNPSIKHWTSLCFSSQTSQISYICFITCTIKTCLWRSLKFLFSISFNCWCIQLPVSEEQPKYQILTDMWRHCQLLLNQTILNLRSFRKWG